MLKSLWVELPAIRYVTVALLLLAAVIAYAASRPAPPEKVLVKYIDSLNRHDCQSAFDMLSDNRKERDPDMDTVESYTRTFCSNVNTSFAKIFVPTDQISASTIGDSADVSYYLCVLPVGFTRRVCTKQMTSLIREGGYWKINIFEIGSWANPHNSRREKTEGLVPDYSPEKH